MKRKLLTMMLAVMVVLGALPGNVMAAEEPLWELEGNIPNEAGVTFFTAQIVNNKIYLIGGITDNNQWTDAVYIYDLHTKTWTPGAKLPVVLAEHTSVVAGDKIYVIGGATIIPGISGSSLNPNMYIYDTATNTWSTGAPMPTLRYLLAAGIKDGKIYTFGGLDSTISANRGTLDVVEIYDITTNSWSKGEPMPKAKYHIFAAVVNNRIYISGGRYVEDNSRYTDIMYYDIDNNSWINEGEITNITSSYTIPAVVVGNNIYYIQRVGSGGVPIYNTVTQSWTQGPMLLEERNNNQAVVSPDNIIYAIGGRNAKGLIRTIERLEVPDVYELSLLLKEDETAQMIITDSVSDNPDYDWLSTNDQKADTDYVGFVTAFEEGTTYIIAESPDGSYQDKISVKIVSKPEEEQLAVYFQVGEEKAFFLNDDYNNIAWSMGDTTIAGVDGMGKVTGVGKGITQVFAEYEGVVYTLFVRVG